MAKLIFLFIFALLNVIFFEKVLCDTNQDQSISFPMFGTQILPYSTDECGSGENINSQDFAFRCQGPFIPCGVDPECQPLGFNRTTLPCACKAEYCPDRLVYGPGGYQNGTGTPLTDDEIAKQPHVIAPCNNCVHAAIAPQHKQIGNCSDTGPCQPPTS